MIGFRIDSNEVLSHLNNAIKSCENMALALEQTEAFLLSKIRNEFQTQSDPYGQPWDPLADSTIRLRKKQGNESTRILYDKGNMFNSLTGVSTDSSVEISIAFPAEVHQDGNPLNRMYGGPLAPIPQRRILPFQGDDVMLPNDWVNQIGGFFSMLLLKDFE